MVTELTVASTIETPSIRVYRFGKGGYVTGECEVSNLSGFAASPRPNSKPELCTQWLIDRRCR